MNDLPSSEAAPRGLVRTTLSWALVAFAALLPVGLLSLYSFDEASRSLNELVRDSNISAGSVTADLLHHDFEESVHLAEMMASLPMLVEAVGRHDEEAVRLRLKGVVESHDEVDRAYVLDPTGVLWSDYPPAPESLGVSFAGRDYYRGLSAKWEPYVSEVFERKARPAARVVAVAVPVKDPQGHVLGGLVFQLRLERISQWLAHVNVGQHGHAFVLDGKGVLAAHPTLNLQARTYSEYASLPPVREALANRRSLTEYDDPLAGQPMVAAFTPVEVGASRWVVVAQQPTREAFAPIRRTARHIAMAGGLMALLALGAAVMLGRMTERARRLAGQLAHRNQELNRLASIVESSDDAIMGMTLEGTLVSWNQAAAKIYGYSAEDVLGKSVSMLAPAERAGEVLRLLARIGEGQGVEHYETVRLRKDGRLFDVSLMLSPIRDGEGRLMGASAIVRDITRHKQVEEEMHRNRERLQLILDNLPDYVFFKDAHSRFVLNNLAHLRQLGAARQDEVLGKTDFDIFPRELAQAYFEDEERIIRTGEPLAARLELTLTPDGKRQWLLTTKVPLRNSKGAVVGLVGIARDVTALREAEERLQEQARDLARSNADLEQFAYVASHDLQEPLRMVASYLQLIERRYIDKLDADGHEFINYAVDGAKRMQSLIGDLLAYSRVGTKGKPLVAVDINQALDRALLNLRVAIAENGAKITHDPLPTVTGDEVQLVQLFQNLVGNAIKFHGENPPEVHVSAQREEGFWRLAVRDNGIGIPPDQFDRIFLIFQRLHTRAEYPGTGIGLAIAKRIVQRHGGRIWVESEPGEGATFCFTLADGERQ